MPFASSGSMITPNRGKVNTFAPFSVILTYCTISWGEFWCFTIHLKLCPDLETAQKLADFFGVSIDYLVYGEEKYGNMASNVSSGSAVIQGSHGNQVSASNQEGSHQGELHEFEGELLSIYRELGLSDKIALLQHALELKKQAGQKE